MTIGRQNRKICTWMVVAVAVLAGISWPGPGWAAPAQAQPLANSGPAHAASLDAASLHAGHGSHAEHLAALAADEPLIPGPNGELPDGWVQTQWGALGPVDRALVEGVRRADLWEGPAGQMATAKGANARVREIGTTISRQHLTELDPLVLKVGAQLGITLPGQPSQEQQDWLAEMQAASGAEFDQVFVDRLRVAHAKVFSLIATVRANTRNSVMREFAQTANKYVDGHIEMLDSTNLVAFNELPTPAVAPAGGGALRSGILTGSGLRPLIIWAILILALIAGAFTAIRILRPTRG